MKSPHRHIVTAVVTVALLALTVPAVAQTTRHYDRQGRVTGWSTQNGAEIRHYDQNGRFVGRTMLRTDEAREYTPGGSLTGRTYFLPDGRVRHYDEHGRFRGESR